MNKNDLIEALNAAHLAFWDDVKGLSLQAANRSIDGKWSPAQHVDHINKCLAPLVKYMCTPRSVIAANFGKSGRASVSMADFISRYRGALSNGLVSPPAFAADEANDLIPAVLVEDGNTSLEMLCRFCDLWTEAELDEHLCPHPALGKLTTREMLYFTIFHAQHHHHAIVRMATE